jgi:hypothetical protein
MMNQLPKMTAQSRRRRAVWALALAGGVAAAACQGYNLV